MLPINDTIKNFISNGGDMSTQEIVAKLSFISRIEENKIIDTQYQTMWDKSYPTSVYRTIIARNQSRNTAFRFFQDTVNMAFSIALSQVGSEDKFIKDMGEMILKALKNCVKGLENYSKTYADDVMFVSKLDALVATINAKVQARDECLAAAAEAKQKENNDKQKDHDGRRNGQR